jgi:hypothetical protein
MAERTTLHRCLSGVPIPKRLPPFPPSRATRRDRARWFTELARGDFARREAEQEVRAMEQEAEELNLDNIVNCCRTRRPAARLRPSGHARRYLERAVGAEEERDIPSERVVGWGGVEEEVEEEEEEEEEEAEEEVVVVQDSEEEEEEAAAARGLEEKAGAVKAQGHEDGADFVRTGSQSESSLAVHGPATPSSTPPRPAPPAAPARRPAKRALLDDDDSDGAAAAGAARDGGSAARGRTYRRLMAAESDEEWE